ncbi:tetratricopeptide repeat protein, partial [Streptomyces cyaneofuscatus]
LGEDHPSTVLARANLAVSYWQAGRIEEAIELLERVVADRERLLGEDHPDTVNARQVLSKWREPGWLLRLVRRLSRRGGR